MENELKAFTRRKCELKHNVAVWQGYGLNPPPPAVVGTAAGLLVLNSGLIGKWQEKSGGQWKRISLQVLKKLVLGSAGRPRRHDG